MPPNNTKAARPGAASGSDQQATEDTNTIARQRGPRHVPGQTELPLRHPAAYVSLYAPHGRRRLWWFAYLCAHCGYGHFGRVSDEASVEGLRRSGCGRLVWIVVARTYRGHESEVAA